MEDYMLLELHELFVQGIYVSLWITQSTGQLVTVKHDFREIFSRYEF